MSDTTSMVEIRTLLDALEVFNQAPDKEAIARANNWLQEFQHSVNLFRHSGHAPEGSDGTLAMAASSAQCMDDLQAPLGNRRGHSTGSAGLRGADPENEGEYLPHKQTR
jgi:hypothetical protein